MAASTLQLGVPAAQAAQATLSWTAPATNSDGSAATDIAGYKVHIGTASGTYDQHIDVGKVTTYSTSALTDGNTYYFAITAYNSARAESRYSNEASKSFAALTRTITATAGAGGTITALNNTRVSTASNGTSTITSVTVTAGGSQSFSIAPATGYKIAGVTVNGTSVGAVASYTFSNVTANQSISATFSANTAASYTITASAGTGGSITPSGAATVTAGGSKAYTIAAATGYRIADVKVDGASVGAVASYTFSNVTANRTIAASFAAATTTTPSSTTLAMNMGGAAFTDAAGVSYRAEANFTGGTAGTSSVPINGTTDDALYQTERWGSSTYNIPIANGNYLVTLKFAETYWTAAGKRVFDVTSGGRTLVSGLDIFSKVGKDTAYDVTVPVSVTNGILNLAFVSKVDNAKICAIKVAPAPATTTTTAGRLVFAANAGGSAFTDSTGTAYQADAYFTGGTAGTVGALAINGTTDDPLYQAERWGATTYNIPMANGNYNLTLKFAENYWTAAGKRVFDVAVGGVTQISNLDVFAKVGKNTAYDVVLPVTVTNGALNVKLLPKIDNPNICALKVTTR